MGDSAQFLAGAWCLDFVNTVEPRTTEGRDYVPDYDALIEWGHQAGLSTAAEAATLRRRPSARDAAVIHNRALQLREVMYRIFHSIATGLPPGDRDLKALRDSQAEAIAQAAPQWDDGLRWTWPSDVEQLRWMLADDAVRLLESPRVRRVKMCRPSCGWLFLDLTRNGSRRWCSTTDCGLREKIRRQAERRAAAHQ